MSITTDPVETLTQTYGKGLAYVAERDSATNLETVTEHLSLAKGRLPYTDMVTAEEIGRVVTCLEEALASPERQLALVKKASRLLERLDLDDAFAEYRGMVGDSDC